MPIISGGGGGGGGVLGVATVSLSSAQILALHSSPVTIVPVRAGYVIWPTTAAVFYKAGTTPYNQQTGIERIVWSGQNEPGDEVFSESVAGVGNAMVFFDLMKYFEGVDLVANFGAVTIDNTVADPTGGNGTAVVTCWYLMIPAT